MTEVELTDEQVDNWRNVLLGQYGPVALIMPRERIQKLRDIMQGRLEPTGSKAAASGGDDE